MKILFFDTETHERYIQQPMHIGDNAQEKYPRIIQLAYILSDLNQNIHVSREHIVKPEGFKISDDSIKIHGITNEVAHAIGENRGAVLRDFSLAASDAEIIVSHNVDFDYNVIRAELNIGFYPNIISTKRRICTMQRSTEYCKIPNEPPDWVNEWDNDYLDEKFWDFVEDITGYKYPSLTELHKKLFGSPFENAHNALADVNATAKCFWELVKVGVIKI